MTDTTFTPAPQTLWQRFKHRLGQIWFIVQLALLFVFLGLALPGQPPEASRSERIESALQGYEFNYVAWEVDALWQKFRQALFGYQPYIDETTGKSVVLDYLLKVGDVQRLEGQIEATFTSNVPDEETQRRQLQSERNRVEREVRDLQPLAEPIIESQVSAVLVELGFEIGGQVMPPVKFRFVQAPDILIISPRDTIRQDFDFSLEPLSVVERDIVEERVKTASPVDSARVTGIGGVGIYPAMIQETQWMAFAYEIVAHEWSHHYLFLYPNGQNYLVKPESRIINETTATVFGNAVGPMVLERFWAEEVAQGTIYVPDYPTLADFFPRQNEVLLPTDYPSLRSAIQHNNGDLWRERVRVTADYLKAMDRPVAAIDVLDTWGRALAVRGVSLLMPDRDNDRATVLNRTRLTVDYLLALDRIEAAEDVMAVQGQVLNIRRLNQAWFAFYGGYQADPGPGGQSLTGITDVLDPNYAGDPIGPAIHEIFERSASPYDFLVKMRDVYTREQLLELLANIRDDG